MLRDHDRASLSGVSSPSQLNAHKRQLERRGQKRHIALLRVALLHAGGIRDLCVVRNISASGLSARVYRKLACGDQVQVEFRSGEPLNGSVVWERGWEVGIAFPQPIDIEAVLASRWVTEIGKRRNLPRIEVKCRGRLKKGVGAQDVLLQDISQGGARVQVEEPVGPGKVVLMLPGLPPLPGVVRWSGSTVVGISFNDSISFEMLARWIQAHRDGR